MRFRLAVVLALLLSPASLLAQPLSDRVPADALIYFGWQGGTQLGAGYEQSHLKGFLDSSNLPQLFNTFLPALIQRVSQEDKDAAEALRIFSTLASPVWKYPTAFYFSGLDFQNPAGPMPKLGLLCKAGKESDSLLAQINDLLARAGGPPPIPHQIFKHDDGIAITIGYNQQQGAFADGGAIKSITASDNFKSAIAQVQKEPLCVLYVDAEGLLNQVNTAVNLFGDAEAKNHVNLVTQATGLGGLKRFIMTSGFDGKDWASQCFIHAPSPRSGLLALLEGKPATDELLRTIPATATWAASADFSIGRIVREARASAGKVDPQAQQMFDQVFAMIQAFTGIDVQREVLDTLGDQWAFYTDPQSAGRGLLALTVVNRLAKPNDFERTMAKITTLADNMINAQIAHEGMRVTFAQTKVGSTAINYISLPFVSPSWAIKDGNLYMALYPQVLAGAVSRNAGTEKSILDNEQFVALRKRLGGEKASGFTFADLPRSIDDSYPMFLFYSQIGLGFADLMGVKTPPMVIPPLPELRKHLAPAARFSRTDEQGWHYKSVTPFPGATLVASEQSLMIGSVATGAGIALPALAKARSRANRVACASNLRQIGQGVMLYAADNKGKYPADLGLLVTQTDLAPRAFICPDGHNSLPGDLLARKPDEQAAWVRDNSDYIYLGAALSSRSPGEAILAYENVHNHQQQGINVLFNDGHVEWMLIPHAMEQIKAQQDKAGKI